MGVTIDSRMMREAFGRRSALVWLLVANCAVFAALRLAAGVGLMTGHDAVGPEAVEALSLPGSLERLLTQPWGLVTYMFTQYDAAHLLFNMLWLAWFGLFVQCDRGNRSLLAMYGTGGVGGAVAYMLWAALAPGSEAVGGLVGASASVMAVAVAITIMEPSRKVGLLFMGEVSLKWVAVAMIVIAVLFFSGYHAGSDAAHAGGAVSGAVYGLIARMAVRRKATSIAERAQATIRPQRPVMTDTELLDSLLDKIRRSGYDSLSDEERTTLFKLSQRIKS